ncbi:hypothetical protein PIB30_070738 [Stylosanthes scabra]|uniref:Uncharacterized protein n=1 Tax=Stylosanthes scabra TaxID=79078 RepID=A0ABU6ZM91_9FABA|nr:hypothetical protein [Stylosanthes scabra]
MNSAAIDRIADIKPSKLEWNLVVGVALIYQMPCEWKSKVVYSLELVLQDKEVCLINLGEQATQPISHVESQGKRFVTEEISSGEIPFQTIEDVYNMIEAFPYLRRILTQNGSRCPQASKNLQAACPIGQEEETEGEEHT